MSVSTQEGLKNAANILSDLADAVSVDSDGGQKITMSELFEIVTKRGIEVINDARDNDDVPGQQPTE